MASATQLKRFRGRVGDTTGAVWTEAEVTDKFDEALEAYPDASDELLLAYAVRSGFEELLANASKRATYTQNETSENLSDIPKALQAAHKIWDAKVKELSGGLSAASGVGVQWGGIRSNTREQEYPNA